MLQPTAAVELLGLANRERPRRSLSLRIPFAASADACTSGSEDLESGKWRRLTGC